MKITVLGCGSSQGVPSIYYGWGDCDANNPKNYRTRSSIVIEQNETTLLVDMSPDLRQQLQNFGNENVDAVLFTHAHYDHVNGINELRPIFLNKDFPLEIFATDETIAQIKKMFFYLFEKNERKIYRPYIHPNILDYGKFAIKNISGECFEQNHGFSTSLGFRIDNFAYSTDVAELSDSMIEKLQNLDVWIVDCLCINDQRPTHATLPIVLKWVDIIKPKQTFLTHMDTSMDYDHLVSILPPNIRPAYDQLTINL